MERALHIHSPCYSAQEQRCMQTGGGGWFSLTRVPVNRNRRGEVLSRGEVGPERRAEVTAGGNHPGARCPEPVSLHAQSRQQRRRDVNCPVVPKISPIHNQAKAIPLKSASKQIPPVLIQATR